MASKSADSGSVPPELDPDNGWALLSRPTPLPEQAASPAHSAIAPASRPAAAAIDTAVAQATVNYVD
jgi:hypothetical protein